MAQKPTFNPRVLDTIKWKRGLHTWDSLAAELGISLSRLKNWRDGKSAPSFAETVSISWRYRIPLEDMVRESYEEITASAA